MSSCTSDTVTLGPHWLEGRPAVVHDAKTGDAITDIDLVQGNDAE
jgi:hypothetical protein